MKKPLAVGDRVKVLGSDHYAPEWTFGKTGTITATNSDFYDVTLAGGTIYGYHGDELELLSPARPFQEGDLVKPSIGGNETGIIVSFDTLDVVSVEWPGGFVNRWHVNLLSPAPSTKFIQVAEDDFGVYVPAASKASQGERSETCTCVSLLSGHENGCSWGKK